MQVLNRLSCHLANNLNLEDKVSSSMIRGNLVCKCLNEHFNILYYGKINNTFFKKFHLSPIIDDLDQTYCIGLIAKCNKCNQEIIIFDSNIHTYDSYFNKKVKLKKEQYILLKCKKCNTNSFKVNVELVYNNEEIKNEFNSLKVAIDNSFNYFDWIKVNLECLQCNKSYKEFIDYETT